MEEVALLLPGGLKHTTLTPTAEQNELAVFQQDWKKPPPRSNAKRRLCRRNEALWTSYLDLMGTGKLFRKGAALRFSLGSLWLNQESLAAVSLLEIVSRRWCDTLQIRSDCTTMSSETANDALVADSHRNWRKYSFVVGSVRGMDGNRVRSVG